MADKKEMDALGALLGLGIMGAILDSDGKGSPDFADMMAKIQREQTESRRPENPFNLDPAESAKKSASMAKQLFDAYVEVGFSEPQAFELVKGILTAKKN